MGCLGRRTGRGAARSTWLAPTTRSGGSDRGDGTAPARRRPGRVVLALTRAGEPALLLDAERVAAEAGGAAAAVLERLDEGDEPRPANVRALRETVRAHLTEAARVPFHLP